MLPDIGEIPCRRAAAAGAGHGPSPDAKCLFCAGSRLETLALLVLPRGARQPLGRLAPLYTDL